MSERTVLDPNNKTAGSDIVFDRFLCSNQQQLLLFFFVLLLKRGQTIFIFASEFCTGKVLTFSVL